MGLVSGAILIGDEMDGRVVDLEVAEPNAGAPEAEQAEVRAEAIDTDIRDFAGRFSAVNDEAASFSFKVKETPVEGGDFNTAAG